MTSTTPQKPPLYGFILVVSAVGIALQILLMRVFSVTQWHHFAYMIISIAMLGFGAGGTLLSLARHRLSGHETGLLFLVSFLVPICLPACYTLSQHVPFELYQLVSQPRQWVYLFLLYLTLAVPFALISICITLAFLIVPGAVARLYAASMIGSGLGALGIIGLLCLASPSRLPFLLAVATALGHILLWRRTKRGWVSGGAQFLALAVLAVSGNAAPLRISEYKPLSYALQLPDARILEERYSPLSVITAVQSQLIRETPGQLGNYPMSRMGPLPGQVGLFFDAGSASPVHDFRDGDIGKFGFLDYTTSAVAYRLVERPRVLVLGSGGGTDVLSALSHGAEHVTAVEVDPGVMDVMTGDLGTFSGNLYTSPGVQAIRAEGRSFLESTSESWDLIQLPLFGSFTAAAAGVYALSESYLYTTQAFELYLRRLSKKGVLAVNCWMKAFPCEAVKLFATCVEGGERLGIADPGHHLVMIRSWNSATLLATRQPLTESQIDAVRCFCRERGFDLCWLPGLRPSETNRYTILERPFYYEAAQALLSPNRPEFYETYLFNVRPATDDCPYFFQFFKWGALLRLLRGMGTEWVPFVEWGYLALLATLLQSLLFGVALILFPVLFGRRRPLGALERKTVFLYFAALGFAYMFLEIALIQKFMLFLAYPMYAVGVVLAALLVFSGCGALWAGTGTLTVSRRVGLAVTGIIVLSACCLLLLPGLFAFAADWADPAKIVLSMFLLAPLAFCMGVPFPAGLQAVSRQTPELVSWVWAVNACTSTIAASLASLTAIHLGFRVVVILAAGMYLLAAGYARNATSQD